MIHGQINLADKKEGQKPFKIKEWTIPINRSFIENQKEEFLWQTNIKNKYDNYIIYNHL